MVSIEIWDTGIGIPTTEMEAIFDEFHQIGNEARESGRGVGLGLAIVKRLGDMLGHRVHVQSRLGKGSAFAIEVALASAQAIPQRKTSESPFDKVVVESPPSGNQILVVEDDPEMRELIELLLTEASYRTAAAADGPAALELVARGTIHPDILLSDYNLPLGMDGLQLAASLRGRLHRPIPVIILTGDISTDAMRKIALQEYEILKKPVNPKELIKVIRDLLARPQLPSVTSVAQAQPTSTSAVPKTIFIVDDDYEVRHALGAVLEDDGHRVQTFATCEAFVEAYHRDQGALVLVDAYLPGMSGLALLQRLFESDSPFPAIMITGNSDVPMAVQAMKAGALDFIEKPVSSSELLASVARALEHSKDSSKLAAWREDAAKRFAGLTARQRQVMELVLAGHPSKNIAASLGINQRTVENHRASIMRRTGAKSLPALARLALMAGEKGDAELTGRHR
jgi:two-component system CheB/CheR fusion protein